MTLELNGRVLLCLLLWLALALATLAKMAWKAGEARGYERGVIDTYAPAYEDGRRVGARLPCREKR